MRPNPWVWVPVLLAGAAGALIGWSVTGAACLPERCAGAQLGAAVVGALLAMVGVGVVSVLAVLSLEEWRSHQEPLEPDESSDPDGAPSRS
ncbi:MAG: hypothetical protein M3N51_08555 [Actinomycetota bacterium]|nr:hypothetical protein [Actinomycetota bacterium]